ncbi:MAG: hypothetical protein KC431_02395, partial [Myxococcales bacterium]|nr:hypothetical protein [Myxococcales bacterium]
MLVRKGAVIILGTTLAVALVLQQQVAVGQEPEAAGSGGPKSGAATSETPAKSDVEAEARHGGLMAVDDRGLLVVEAQEGALLRVDREGAVKATLQLKPTLGELVHGGADRVFLADRAGDRVIRVDIGSAGAETLKVAGELAVREPHGLALSADGATLLVTSVADHALVVVDAATLKERWRVELLPEPRPVALSPDGHLAAVGFLSSGALAFVDLRSRAVSWRSLDPRDHVIIETDRRRAKFSDEIEEIDTVRIGEARSRFRVPVETGRRYARNVARLAWLGDSVLALHQLATPQMRRVPPPSRGDSYGGGGGSEGEDVPPLVYRMARIDEPGTLGSRVDFMKLDLQLPRALAYDAERDKLFIVGYGTDQLLVFSEAASPGPRFEALSELGKGCGPDALVLDPDGAEGESSARLWVHCELTRELIGIDYNRSLGANETHGPLLASTRSPQAIAGAELF